MSYSVNTISAESTAVISRQAISEQQLQVNRVKAGTVQENGNKVEDRSAITSTFGTSADKIEISPEGRKALEQIYAARAAKANAAKTAAATEAAPKAPVVKPSEALSTKPEAEKVQTAKPAEAAEPVKTEAKPAEQAAEAAAPKAEQAAKPEAPVEKPEKPVIEKPKVQVKEEAPEFKLELPGTGAQEAVAETDGVSSSEIQNMSVSELRSAVTEGTITPAQMDDELSRRKAAEQQSEQKAAEAQEAMNEALNSMKDMNKAAENMSTFSTVKQYAAVAQALA